MSTNTNRVNNPMKVITGPDTRWSYANVWEPKSINGGTPKYSVSLIIPKSDTKTVAKIKAAIEAAYQEGQAKLKGNSKSVPPLAAIKTPLRDGDIERPDDPAYANAYFINANSATAPGIVDADRNPVLTRSEVYSGVYGRASINLYAFNSNGNKGIACGLNNLQLIRAGEPLGGKASAESDLELTTILCILLLSLYLLLAVFWIVRSVIDAIDDHERKKRNDAWDAEKQQIERERALREVEYHEARMKNLHE